MAIDKSRTKPWVKAVLIFLSIAFVISFIPLGLSGLFSSGSNKTTTQQTNPYTAIDAKNKAITDAFKKDAASAPASAAAQIALANAYLDWVTQIETQLQADSQKSGRSVQTTQQAQQRYTIYVSARDAYAQAVKVSKTPNPQVLGDYAIALFYTNDVKGAITQSLAAIKAKPDFAVVWFNLGNFYAQDKQTAKAIAAYQQYLKLAPTGDRAQVAKQNIAQLQNTK